MFGDMDKLSVGSGSNTFHLKKPLLVNGGEVGFVFRAPFEFWYNSDDTRKIKKKHSLKVWLIMKTVCSGYFLISTFLPI